jgi:hypothetical protein
MDRSITERLNRLSKELAADKHEMQHHTHELDELQLQALSDRIDDIQDEIWDIEDALRDEAEYEYSEHSAKGWN